MNKIATIGYFDGVHLGHSYLLEQLKSEFPNSNFYYLTTKTKQKYTDIKFMEGDFFVFS